MAFVCALIITLCCQFSYGQTDRILYGPAVEMQFDLTQVILNKNLNDEYYLRRQLGWALVEQVFSEVKISDANLQISDANVPRWLTWLESNEGAYLFSRLYLGLTRAERTARADLNKQKVFNEISFLPEALRGETYFSRDHFARSVQTIANRKQLLGVRGPPQILLDPHSMAHEFTNYKKIYDCIRERTDLSPTRVPERDSNHSLCFRDESPQQSVIVKAMWRRVHDNVPLMKFDTSGEGLENLMNSGSGYEWVGEPVTDKPQGNQIFEIEVPSGQRYQLVGFHLMSKIKRDWVWVTLWWSDSPYSDFGEDRPAQFKNNQFALENYKMCVVTDYLPDQTGLSNEFRSTYPSLTQATVATRRLNPSSSWCSNPYIEKGHNNARTNCIGCHQHGGTTFDIDQALQDDSQFEQMLLLRNRTNFAADYYWAFRNLKSGAEPTPQKIVDLVDYIDSLGDDAYRSRMQIKKFIWGR